MNYYYEIPDEETVFGRGPGYYCYPNCSPAQGGFMNTMVHNTIFNHSSRVWLENANGVVLIKEPNNPNAFSKVNSAEFVMIKLKARDFSTWL